MLSASKIEAIKKEVELAANRHLNASDAKTSLSHFTDDVFAVSNIDMYPTLESLASDVKDYYAQLKKVNCARWEDAHIKVISEKAATFTAKFRYEFTCSDSSVVKLRGVWTALFVLVGEDWKIQLRHESFEEVK